jgi:hypothetical protein
MFAFGLAAALVATTAGATTTRQNTSPEAADNNHMAQGQGGQYPELVPTGKGYGRVPGKAKGGGHGGGGGSNNGIFYHGGPVMTSDVNVYYVWYGDWSGNSATTILTDLANSIGNTPYFDINTTYTDGNSTPVNGNVWYQGATTDPYTYGTSLTDTQIRQVVADAISSNRLPSDADGVYFVLTSSDVTASSGFCTSYCGWHTHASIGGTDIKYSFVGNPDRCPSACEYQTVGPNGNAGADGMASIIAHELEEAVTDPDLNAWYDRRGYENADKCAWTFGTTYTANGALANVHMGTRDYLIQRNWVNAGGGYCSMAYP